MSDKANIQTLRRLLKSAEGSGHNVHFGGHHKRRYNSETGKPYYTDDPGTLSTSSAKMRAIWAAWEALPHLLDRIERLESRAAIFEAETPDPPPTGVSPLPLDAGRSS